MSRRCFVIQRFDGARFDDLYDQVFKPAIEKAGFEPYRVDKDPGASIPIESIEREITEADACFAELSEDAPNVWFEVGYSIARDKPLCLVCSTARTRFPFDIQHRQIIRYPDQPVPKDFIELGERIVERLTSVARKDVALQQNVDAAKALSVGPNVSGLRPHELLALTIIFQSALGSEVSGWILKQEMERAGYTAIAANLAIAGLKSKKFIESETRSDRDGDLYLLFKTTNLGEEWLMEHQDELNLVVEKPIDFITTFPDGFTPTADDENGITDDDIPF